MAQATQNQKVAVVEWNAVKQRWEATYKSQVLVKSPNINYVVSAIREGKNPKAKALGISDVVGMKDGEQVDISTFLPPVVGKGGSRAAKAVEQQEYFNKLTTIPIDQRIAHTRRVVQMVLGDVAHAAIVVGPGGLGKTFLVLDEIEKMGLKPATYMDSEAGAPAEITGDEEPDELEAKVFDASEIGGDYVHIKGFSTARSLYRTLFKYRFKTVIFDDCDNIQKDPNAVNILKAVLDTGRERWVHWMSEPIGGSDIPTAFQFHGRVIFVSNLDVESVDQALRTRAYILDLSMTAEQKMQYMKSALKRVAEDMRLSMPKLSANDDEKMDDYVVEAYNFLDAIKEEVKELNFRTLLGIIRIRVGCKKEWKDLAEYMAKFGFR